MPVRNTHNTYGSVNKFFHWLIFLLVLFMLIYGFLLDRIPDAYQGIAYNIHKLTGLTILSLMVLRLIWALFNPKPVLLHTNVFEKFMERLVHWSLYLFLILMPLAGWIGSSAAGRAPHLGNLQLMLPVAQDKNLVTTSFELHNKIAIVLIVLISIHFLAGLYHYFIRRDDVLQRMMPGYQPPEIIDPSLWKRSSMTENNHS